MTHLKIAYPTWPKIARPRWPKFNRTVVIPALLLVLPVLISGALILPACIMGQVVYYNAGGVTFSIGGTGYLIDETALDQPKLNYTPVRYWPQAIQMLPKLFIVQLVVALLVVCYALGALTIAMLQVRDARKRSVVQDGTRPTSRIDPMAKGLKWIMAATILLAMAMVSLDVAMFFATKNVVSGIGIFELEWAGYVAIWGGGGLTLVWSTTWAVVMLMTWRHQRAETRSICEKQEEEFMPELVGLDVPIVDKDVKVL